MPGEKGRFALIFFILLCFQVQAQQCLQVFLDSVNQAILLKEGQYHVVFRYSDISQAHDIIYEGTCFFSKDSVPEGGIANFFMFEGDSTPLFAYFNQRFYKFNASQKQYTSQSIARPYFYRKIPFDFKNSLVVQYILNNSSSPFTGALKVESDSAFCDSASAGYMKKDTLRSGQYGEEFIKEYFYVKRNKGTQKMEISTIRAYPQKKDLYPAKKQIRIWQIDQLKKIKNGRQLIQKYIDKIIPHYTLSDAGPPGKDGEKH